MAILYKPTYTKDSPEFSRALDYIRLTSGGALVNPTVNDSLLFTGPEGSYEDIQVQFPAPPSAPAFHPVMQSPPQTAITARSTIFQASIDLLVQYPNISLVEMSSLNLPYQFFVLNTPLDNYAQVLHQLAIVTPPPTVVNDGNLWLGPKQTNVGKPDQVGDRRYSAPTDTSAAGGTTQFNGLNWKKIEYLTPFTGGKQVWWQAITAG